MKLHITDEFSVLTAVVVCWGDQVPKFGEYQSEDPEFLKFHPFGWDKELLLRQQEKFFKRLERYGITLLFPKTDPSLPWQMYTRDTGFVVGNRFYYAKDRKFGERRGEIDKIFPIVKQLEGDIVGLRGEVEGGDVLVSSSQEVFVGHSSRTNQEAIDHLGETASVRILELGDRVMHLDTRLVLLPGNKALIHKPAFAPKELEGLEQELTLIDITKEEITHLGTNVFVVNSETVFVPSQHQRIGNVLSGEGFNVEFVEYTEPIALGGSFRCTTLPLCRA